MIAITQQQYFKHDISSFRFQGIDKKKRASCSAAAPLRGGLTLLGEERRERSSARYQGERGEESQQPQESEREPDRLDPRRRIRERTTLPPERPQFSTTCSVRVLAEDIQRLVLDGVKEAQHVSLAVVESTENTKTSQLCVFGCSMFTSVKAFEGQQYSTLKRQCLQSGLLFEDPRFPATDDSLFYQGNRIGRVVWKRPRQAVVLDGVTSFCLCAAASTSSVHCHGNWVTQIICFGLC
eukprot:superscaffoldBa00001515_g10906